MIQDYEIRAAYIEGQVVFAINNDMSTEDMLKAFGDLKTYRQFYDKVRRLEHSG